MPLKIAICGKMGSGKTTLANSILENHLLFQRRSLAEGVKKFARFVYDIPEGKKDRILFQKVGDGARNELYEDVWITTMLNTCKRDDYIVVDDVRYYNEVLKLKKQGWKIIKINIDNQLQEERIKNTYPDDWEIHLNSRGHNSEIEVDLIPEDLFDMIIEATNDEKPKSLLDEFVKNNLNNYHLL